MEAKTSTNAAKSSNASISPPKRFIYTQADMEAFRTSPVKRELLSFASAMGRACATTSQNGQYDYDPQNPLHGLSPAMASLHGSLRQMADHWLKEIPPDKNARARFGNPSFRTWHARLVKRSRRIVQSVLDCHRTFGVVVAAATAKDEAGTKATKTQQESRSFPMSVLEKCSEAGYTAASGTDATTNTKNDSTNNKNTFKEEEIITELTAYLHDSFGHPTRLDYGTGHESSFLVLSFSLGKIGCFGNARDVTPVPPIILAPIALSVFSQYLQVTRGLQSDYMLEPAGSHGVWGLDDYHCLPFYFGSCQLQQLEVDYPPSIIHKDSVLRSHGDKYMYFGCIRYIKSLKKNVPFFESSPMLNDISHLPNWTKVSGGLLRLYEGEVLDKMPVVQHFVFGNIFKATWTPKQQPREAPTRTFINGPGGEECIAPWAEGSGVPPPPPPPSSSSPGGLPPPARAPWAK